MLSLAVPAGPLSVLCLGAHPDDIDVVTALGNVQRSSRSAAAARCSPCRTVTT